MTKEKYDLPKLFGRSDFMEGLFDTGAELSWNASGGGRISCESLICDCLLIGCGGAISLGDIGDWAGGDLNLYTGCLEASSNAYSASSELVSAILGIEHGDLLP